MKETTCYLMSQVFALPSCTPYERVKKREVLDNELCVKNEIGGYNIGIIK